MKRTIKIVIMAFMLVSTMTGIKAQENNSRIYYEEIIPETVHLIDSLFESNTGEIAVKNENGVDKSKEFVEENSNYYITENWDELMNSYKESGYHIEKSNDSILPSPRYRERITKNFKYSYHLLTINGRVAAEIGFTLYGSASSDTASGKLSNASMGLSGIIRPGGWEDWETNLNYNTTYSSTLRSVTFEYVYLNIWASQSFQNINARVYYDEIKLGNSFTM